MTLHAQITERGKSVHVICKFVFRSVRPRTHHAVCPSNEDLNLRRTKTPWAFSLGIAPVAVYCIILLFSQEMRSSTV